MREVLNEWDFVIAAYAVGIIGTLLMVSWSWVSMRRAEARRERSRGR
jgi:hypothetical protein